MPTESSRTLDETRDIEKLESEVDLAAGLVIDGEVVERAAPDATSNEKDAVVLDWDGPDDPDDPQGWPLRKKLLLLNTVGLLCFTVTFGTSVIIGGVPQIMQKYNVGEVPSYLTVTLYLLGLALGPTLGAPISELYGRRTVYIVTLPLAMCFAVGTALSPTFGGHLVCRFLCGLMGSPVLAVSAGTIADVFVPRDRGLALAFFCATGPFAGPTLGPVAGGWIATRKNWQWTMWLYLMICGAVLIPIMLIRESYKPVILKRRAKARGLPLPATPPLGIALKMVATITLTRPMRMLFTDAIVGSLSLYASFVFAVLLGFFEALPYIFMNVYGFSIGDAGLVFIAIGVGILLSVVVSYLIEIHWYFPAAAACAPGEQPRAELRLYCAFVGSFLLPISLFWVGWTARPSVPWIVPALAGIPFGCSLTLLFFSIATYMVDCYGHLLGASALAANNLARYTVAAAFPLFINTMYQNLGIGWASSLLGFIGVGLLPLPFVMYRFGPALRLRGLRNFGLA
ncbi:major facilitator superfamily domain-containing protein [Limtongia smithiae]|uniref:major facilitator superfamily domain-containing protein n=1 Tax=Limtongia smithiae TaxID=1125753 RepID=UPI0034CF7004